MTENAVIGKCLRELSDGLLRLLPYGKEREVMEKNVAERKPAVAVPQAVKAAAQGLTRLATTGGSADAPQSTTTTLSSKGSAMYHHVWTLTNPKRPLSGPGGERNGSGGVEREGPKAKIAKLEDEKTACEQARLKALLQERQELMERLQRIEDEIKGLDVELPPVNGPAELTS
jgi:hypothetical protein